MIGSLRGRVLCTYDNKVLIDVGGVGYEVIALPSDSVNSGDEAFLYIAHCINQEKVELFGFSEHSDKELFLIIRNISGVSYKIAMNIASTDGKSTLARAISQNESAILATLPGVGLKTAAKIMLEVKDNKKLLMMLCNTDDGSNKSDAIAALIGLGIKRNVALSIIENILRDRPALSAEDIVKLALRDHAK